MLAGPSGTLLRSRDSVAQPAGAQSQKPRRKAGHLPYRLPTCAVRRRGEEHRGFVTPSQQMLRMPAIDCEPRANFGPGLPQFENRADAGGPCTGRPSAGRRRQCSGQPRFGDRHIHRYRRGSAIDCGVGPRPGQPSRAELLRHSMLRHWPGPLPESIPTGRTSAKSRGYRGPQGRRGRVQRRLLTAVAEGRLPPTHSTAAEPPPLALREQLLPG